FLREQVRQRRAADDGELRVDADVLVDEVVPGQEVVEAVGSRGLVPPVAEGERDLLRRLEAVVDLHRAAGVGDDVLTRGEHLPAHRLGAVEVAGDERVGELVGATPYDLLARGAATVVEYLDELADLGL